MPISSRGQCQCRSLAYRVDESEMTDTARATLVSIDDGDNYMFRCSACRQCWEFYFFGREEAPTFQKIDWRDAQKIMAAREAQKPSPEAREAAAAAEIADEQRFETLQARALAAAPFTRLLRIVSGVAIAIATLLSLSMAFAGSDPAPRVLGIAAGLFAVSLTLAAWAQWREKH